MIVLKLLWDSHSSSDCPDAVADGFAESAPLSPCVQHCTASDRDGHGVPWSVTRCAETPAKAGDRESRKKKSLRREEGV